MKNIPSKRNPRISPRSLVLSSSAGTRMRTAIIEPSEGLAPKTSISLGPNPSIPSYLSFTRASTGYYVNSSGYLASAGSNVARGEYRLASIGATPTYMGCLFEPASTNLLLRSNDFANATWTKSNITATNINTLAGMTDVFGSADSGLNCGSLVDTGTGTHRVTQSVSFTSGTTYTLSACVTAGDLNGPRCTLVFPAAAFGSEKKGTFNLSTGVFDSLDAGLTGRVEILGTARKGGACWFRISVSAAATATASGAVAIGLDNGTTDSYFGGLSTGMYVTAAQCEACQVPTSPIITVGSTVTRAADDLRDASGISGFFPGGASTGGPSSWVIQAASKAAGSGIEARVLYCANSGFGHTRQVLLSQTGAGVRARADNYNAANDVNSTVANTVAFGSPVRIGVRWKSNDVIGCVNGTLGTQDTSCTMSTDLIYFRVATSLANATFWLQSIDLYDFALTNADLQGSTA